MLSISLASAWISIFCGSAVLQDVNEARNAEDTPAPSYVDSFAAAQVHLAAGELAGARADLDSCLRIAPDSSISAYALACISARLGDADRALAELARAVAIGWDDPALAAWDEDLASLCETPEFGALLRAMAERRPSARLETTSAVELPNTVAHERNLLAQRPAISPDGRLLAIPDVDGSIEGVDPDTGRRMRTWSGGPPNLLGIAWRYDGALLSIAQDDYSGPSAVISVWNAGGGAPVASFSVRSSGQPLASKVFRPDGRRAITVGYRDAPQVWDTLAGTYVGTVDVDEAQAASNPWIPYATANAWSRDSKQLALATWNSEVWSITEASGKLERRRLWSLDPRTDDRGTRIVSELEFDPTGELLAIGLAIESTPAPTSRTREAPKVEIVVLDVDTGRESRRFDATIASPLFYGVVGLGWSSDGRTLVAVGHGDVSAWDVARGESLWSWSHDSCGDEREASALVTRDRHFVAVFGHACREGVWSLDDGTWRTWPSSSGTRTWLESSRGSLLGIDGGYVSVHDAATFARRCERWRSRDDELVLVDSTWFDGTAGAIRSGLAVDRGGAKRPLADLAPRRWDPKRVRALQAGVRLVAAGPR